MTNASAAAGMDRAGIEHGGRPVIDELLVAHWKATPEGGEPVEITAGTPWPATGARVGFDRHTVTVPAEWPLDDVRLELDVGSEASVTMHSRFGIESHRIDRGGGALVPPARAFGIRIAAEPPASGALAVFGATRLVLLGP